MLDKAEAAICISCSPLVGIPFVAGVVTLPLESTTSVDKSPLNNLLSPGDTVLLFLIDPNIVLLVCINSGASFLTSKILY